MCFDAGFVFTNVPSWTGAYASSQGNMICGVCEAPPQLGNSLISGVDNKSQYKPRHVDDSTVYSIMGNNSSNPRALEEALIFSNRDRR